MQGEERVVGVLPGDFGLGRMEIRRL